MAVRRARVRQHFIDNLEESRLVLDTKIDGFLAITHLWAGEALYTNQPPRSSTSPLGRPSTPA